MVHRRLWCAVVSVACAGCARGPFVEPDTAEHPSAVPVTSASPRVSATSPYFPSRDAWESRSPAELGFDEAKLKQAVEFAQSRESDWDFAMQTRVFGSLLGPIPMTRARTNGVIIRSGYIVATFGDTNAPDPTYSVAKSYLATLLGLAIDRGLIPNIDRPVGELVHDDIGGGYESAHNAAITWRHHATQTSEWQGEMYGKPSTFIGSAAFGSGEMKPRDIKPPGTHFEYNDVRVNRFALSLLHVWRRPLTDVLRREIMDPIGASDSWRWVPYDNALFSINGQAMPSVSGGTRWGGGLWISAMDHARFGLLMLRKGDWNGKQILSKRWVAEAARPQHSLTGARPDYGCLWWLNTQDRWPGTPRDSYSAQGAGDNSIWIDPSHDLVVVWRWHRGGDAQAEFYRRILSALK